MSVTTDYLDLGNALYILDGGVEIEYKGGKYVCTRQGKGGSIEFSPHGGVLTANGERVGTIYLDETPAAEYETCYWSQDYNRRCECGNTTFPDSILRKFPTAIETIVDATFMYVC